MEGVLACITVALKKLSHGRPNLGGGGVIVMQHVEDLGGELSIEPLDDRKIILDPLRIMGTRNTSVGDMGPKIASA